MCSSCRLSLYTVEFYVHLQVKDSTFLSTERRNNNAEKQIITDSLNNSVFAAAQHAFAIVSLRRLFKPRLSTHWHTASYPHKGWIQSHFSFRDRDRALPGSTKTVSIPSMSKGSQTSPTSGSSFSPDFPAPPALSAQALKNLGNAHLLRLWPLSHLFRRSGNTCKALFTRFLSALNAASVAVRCFAVKTSLPLPLSQGVTVMVPVALLVMPSGWLLSLWTSVLEYE